MRTCGGEHQQRNSWQEPLLRRYHVCERTNDLIALLGRPDTKAISRSRASIAALTAFSPPDSSVIELGTFRLELRLPSA